MDQAEWQNIKSLFHQALDLAPDDRTALLQDSCNGREHLRARVESLLKAHKDAGDFISAPALCDAGLIPDDSPNDDNSLIGKQICNYTIVRQLGRGGMGSVFLASRAGTGFNKQVALKIIKRGMDTDAILQRFGIERQILANLQHPNIAGFLDGGTTADGLPFFVMEYVDGEPITKYCDTRNLTTAERLKLFQTACTAVRHAHQNLVVHRDLKPSNILVTGEGIPKLLDFGIAKLVSSDPRDEVEQTATAFRVMTPEYASPEQIRGLPITTATDVYSLGVVLYELLSGQRPYHFPSRDPEEVARLVLTTDPLPPSEVVSSQCAAISGRRTANHRGRPTDNEQVITDGREVGSHSPIRNSKSLRGDLDNIVLKALRKDRERRYASVLELSEDIRRHLSGLPVTARPDTFTYRAGKFIQRHRVGVAAAALILATLLAATVVTSWESYIARREHAKAELRSADQRKLVSTLINDVQTSLKGVPHSLTAQRMLAQKSLEYLNNLAKDAGDDPQYLGELADAYRNLGYLQTWTLQDQTSALLTYERASELCHKRLAIEPKGLAARRCVADLLGNKIEALNLLMRSEDSAAAYAEKLPLEQQLLDEDPQNTEALMRVAQTFEAYGEILNSLDQKEEANPKFEAAVELTKRAIDLTKVRATTPQQQVDLSFMEENLGQMYEQLQQTSQAIEAYRQAVATASAVHAEHPEIAQAYRNTTSSHWYLGMLLDRQGDHQGALENYRVSLKTALDSNAVDPSVDPLRSGETKYSLVVGKALCKLGQTEDGVRLIHHGIDLLLPAIESDKSNRQSTYWGSELLRWAAEGLAAAGFPDEARSLSLKMITWAEETAQNAPADGGPKIRIVMLYEQLGDVYSGHDSNGRTFGPGNRGRLRQARDWYQKALNQLNDIDESFHVSKFIRQDRLNALREKISQCDAQIGG